MAHFAQLDENNLVTQVIVINNENTCDFKGVEVEEIGIGFCKKLFGSNTNWKQTSYNGNFRVRYAGIGYSYNEVLDAFIPPKPFPSWILNTNTADWESPLGPAPTSDDPEAEPVYYYWDEDAYQADNTTGWVLKN